MSPTKRSWRRWRALALLLAAADPGLPAPARALLAGELTDTGHPEPGEAAVSRRRAAL
ncbi:hypothetical protein ABZ807_12360 [Micromonospora sp. NPDC047548]|uniref:hypothetical protein n=1 Tax=Micromonospora sp. NPDC047548 TaxID=3155624 RepID=UPI0033F41EAF